MSGRGAEGIRTPDFRSASAALYQLSYSPGPGRVSHVETKTGVNDFDVVSWQTLSPVCQPLTQ